jgi:hypothetical protein
MKFALFLMFLAYASYVAAGPFEIRYQQEDGSGNIFGNWITPNPSTGLTGFYSYDGTSKAISWVTVGSGLSVSSGVLSANSITSGQINSALGYVPYNSTNPNGYISNINSAQVTSALGFTPYNATNPSSYINQAQARTSISLTNTGSGAASYNNSTGVLNIPTPATPAAQSINDTPGRSLVTTTSSTGYQISATRNSLACYEGSFATTSTIGGPASASVYLETADTNSTTPGDWTTKAQQTYTNTITLAVVLNQVQANNWAMCRMIPAGKYVRLRSGNITGTASVSLNATQQETLQ